MTVKVMRPPAGMRNWTGREHDDISTPNRIKGSLSSSLAVLHEAALLLLSPRTLSLSEKVSHDGLDILLAVHVVAAGQHVGRLPLSFMPRSFIFSSVLRVINS